MLHPTRVNANLADILDGPLKDRHSVIFTEKDTEVAESLTRDSTALQTHLLRLADLLMALTQRLDQPNAATTIQPIMT